MLQTKNLHSSLYEDLFIAPRNVIATNKCYKTKTMI